MFHQFLRPVITILCIAIPIWLILRSVILLNKNKQNRAFSFKREVIMLLLYVYILLVLIITNYPIPYTEYRFPKEIEINIIPIIFTTKVLINSIASGNTVLMLSSLENIFGNIILFIPLGLLLPLIFQKIRSAKSILLISFLFSFTIELMQLISRQFGNYRTADIDDIILNISGAILGYVIFKSVHKILGREVHS